MTRSMSPRVDRSRDTGTGSAYEAVDLNAEASPVWSLKRLVRNSLARAPGARARFAGSLADALRTAENLKRGFFLNVADARAALGSALLIRIDPGRLALRLMERCKIDGRSVGYADCFLGAGDWSPLLVPIQKSPSYWELKLIQSADLDYEKTLCFERYLARAKAGDPVKRNHVVLDSPTRIHAYLGHSAALLRSVRERGVLPRETWRRKGGARRREMLLEASEQEVGIAVGPGGELYRFCAGKHRTAAALLLRIPSIPVEVRMVHARWLAERREEAGGDALAGLVQGIRAFDTGAPAL